MNVLDRNGTHLSVGMRVEKRGREGEVTALLSPYRVYVRWDNDEDEELESADTLTTVSRVWGGRRRR